MSELERTMQVARARPPTLPDDLVPDAPSPEELRLRRSLLTLSADVAPAAAIFAVLAVFSSLLGFVVVGVVPAVVVLAWVGLLTSIFAAATVLAAGMDWLRDARQVELAPGWLRPARSRQITRMDSIVLPAGNDPPTDAHIVRWRRWLGIGGRVGIPVFLAHFLANALTWTPNAGPWSGSVAVLAAWLVAAYLVGALVLVLAHAASWFVDSRRPRVKATPHGFKVGERFVAWEEIQSWRETDARLEVQATRLGRRLRTPPLRDGERAVFAEMLRRHVHGGAPEVPVDLERLRAERPS